MRTCIFCGDTGMTAEDAWPLWLLRRFPTPSGVTVSSERRGRDPAQWQQADMTQRIRTVCGACNNGWMSALENEAKPIIERLLDDQVSSITTAEQAILTRWSIKSAMVFEGLRGTAEWFYEQDDRGEIAAGAISVNRTNVWMAKCVDLPSIHCVSSDMADAPHPHSATVRGYVTTMAFGNLALQVVSLKVSGAAAAAPSITTGTRGTAWPDVLLQIGPPGVDRDWPQPLGLNGEIGVEELSLRFRLEDHHVESA